MRCEMCAHVLVCICERMAEERVRPGETLNSRGMPFYGLRSMKPLRNRTTLSADGVGTVRPLAERGQGEPLEPCR